MTALLLSDHDLEARRAVTSGPLHALTDSLATDLDQVLARPVYFPRDKALLSRDGGRCPHDGALLDFDPFSPHEHRCPRCGAVYGGELHDRFWIYWYQLWLAERAVHAAALSRVAGLARFERLASDILSGYVERYLSYPNADNVLGPTRLFFSTYLESIWLLQICVATRLLDRALPSLASRVRDRIIEPSRAIISEYDEGGSNRQVWNDAALLAAAVLLDDHRAAENAVFAGSGVAGQLTSGILDDGTWYEGENYHLFAHRGLWYGVTLAEAAGLELPAPLLDRFQQGFSTPFLTSLPDFTLPSRRDSQYAISLRQWRIAEHCELGLVRRNDGSLRDALRRLYRDDVPRRATGRDTSAADVERNMPATSLDRSDLSWRALLFALPELPHLDAAPIRSAILGGQGIAVFRRDSARTYVALDYGHSGGGHGHPDRLNLLLAAGDTRWLDDMGTGSYVERTLHWYRSTLAHNAPLVDGRSQRPVDGVATAYDERGAAGWIRATAEVAPGVAVHRELVVMPDYAIDTVSWSAASEVTFDLPLHVDVELSDIGSAVPAEFQGGTRLEDGFEFAHDASVQRIQAGVTVVGRAHSGESARLALWATSTTDCEWWRAVAPGAPGRGEAAFRLMRARGSKGAYALIWSWHGAVSQVDFGDVIRVALADGSIHEHTATADGRHVELHAGRARSSIDLAGRIEPSARESIAVSHGRSPTPPAIALPSNGRAVSIELGEPHYRRSEQRWREAGAPTASVSLRWCAPTLTVSIDVPNSVRNFAPSDATNAYDNEHPDINGDGVQLYLQTDRGESAWMLVPDAASSAVRSRQLDDWSSPQPLHADWRPTASGYQLTVDLDTQTPPLALDVVVNEMPRDRARRRGQLVLSGARGDFVYLRGDRHDRWRLVPLRIRNA